MEFKGSKGNWKVGELNKNKVWVIRDNEISSCVCELSNQHFQSFIRYTNIPKTENEYNAKLISKAPEMLEMLEEAQKIICSMKLSMWIHPDCSRDSEFYDMCKTGEEIEDKIQDLIKEATTI